MIRTMLVCTTLALIALSAPGLAQVNGAAAFRQRCSSCHALKPTAGKMAGPLGGVVGRKAGSATGARSSRALVAWGRTWNRPNLEAYLASPTRTVPGTTMVIGLSDAAARKAIIDYLAAQK